MIDSIPQRLDVVRRRSRELLIDFQHDSGSFPAATDFSVYRDYCWFRDGSFVADTLSQLGEAERATAFHRWCAKVVDDRAFQIDALVQKHKTGTLIEIDEFLPTRYTLGGDEGSEAWWNFQLDGYGTWLFVLAQHLDRHDVDAQEFVPAIEQLVRYLHAFGDRSCFDWWEEFEDQQHVSTLGAVSAGLQAASEVLVGEVAELAKSAAERIRSIVTNAHAALGYLPKWVGFESVDGSLLSCLTPFEIVEPGTAVAERTYERIVTELVNDGVFRYRGDTFYGGGEWILLTALLGLYEVETNRLGLATKRLHWIVAQADLNGDLPEQTDAHCQFPDRVQEWKDRWGTVATPLLWSHAMFLQLDRALALHESRQTVTTT